MTREQAEAQLGLKIIEEWLDLLSLTEGSISKSGVVEDPLRFLANTTASALGTYLLRRGVSEDQLTAFFRAVADLSESGEGRAEATRVHAQARGERAS